MGQQQIKSVTAERDGEDNITVRWDRQGTKYEIEVYEDDKLETTKSVETGYGKFSYRGNIGHFYHFIVVRKNTFFDDRGKSRKIYIDTIRPVKATLEQNGRIKVTWTKGKLNPNSDLYEVEVFCNEKFEKKDGGNPLTCEYTYIAKPAGRYHFVVVRNTGKSTSSHGTSPTIYTVPLRLSKVDGQYNNALRLIWRKPEESVTCHVSVLVGTKVIDKYEVKSGCTSHEMEFKDLVKRQVPNTYDFNIWAESASGHRGESTKVSYKFDGKLKVRYFIFLRKSDLVVLLTMDETVHAHHRISELEQLGYEEVDGVEKYAIIHWTDRPYQANFSELENRFNSLALPEVSDVDLQNLIDTGYSEMKFVFDYCADRFQFNLFNTNATISRHCIAFGTTQFPCVASSAQDDPASESGYGTINAAVEPSSRASAVTGDGRSVDDWWRSRSDSIREKGSFITLDIFEKPGHIAAVLYTEDKVKSQEVLEEFTGLDYKTVEGSPQEFRLDRYVKFSIRIPGHANPCSHNINPADIDERSYVKRQFTYNPDTPRIVMQCELEQLDRRFLSFPFFVGGHVQAEMPFQRDVATTPIQAQLDRTTTSTAESTDLQREPKHSTSESKSASVFNIHGNMVGNVNMTETPVGVAAGNVHGPTPANHHTGAVKKKVTRDLFHLGACGETSIQSIDETSTTSHSVNRNKRTKELMKKAAQEEAQPQTPSSRRPGRPKSKRASTLRKNLQTGNQGASKNA